MVFNLTLHYVQNVEDAEEITQDTFVKIHDKMGTFRQMSNLKTWIYRIAINQSLDFIKSKKSQKSTFLSSFTSINDAGFHYQPANFNHPGIELEQKESAHRIFRVLNQLSENHKTVLILTKIECHSPAETAEIMNLSIKAVESLVHRAKNNLEKLLINEEK